MITAEDFKKGKEASIIELMVLGRQLGIDVDSVRDACLEAEFRELSAKIHETLAKPTAILPSISQ